MIIEMEKRVAKVAVPCTVEGTYRLEYYCRMFGIVLKMEKAEALSPRELLMSLTTFTTVTLGMLLVTITIG